MPRTLFGSAGQLTISKDTKCKGQCESRYSRHGLHSALVCSASVGRHGNDSGTQLNALCGISGTPIPLPQAVSQCSQARLRAYVTHVLTSLFPHCVCVLKTVTCHIICCMYNFVLLQTVLSDCLRKMKKSGSPQKK